MSKSQLQLSTESEKNRGNENDFKMCNRGVNPLFLQLTVSNQIEYKPKELEEGREEVGEGECHKRPCRCSQVCLLAETAVSSWANGEHVSISARKANRKSNLHAVGRVRAAGNGTRLKRN